MMNRILLLLLIAGTLTFSACDDDDNQALPTMFDVTVENVSTANLIASPRAMGTVPLSPPAYAVFQGDDPMFMSGQMANVGTARIAEDGFPMEMLAILQANNRVSESGAAESPGGPDNGPALFAGESATFTVMASPGDRLQLETMFVQSNDWFYAFSNGGLELFNGNDPISGDVTDRIDLYDAGTEQDTAPGTGPTALPGPVQKPVQDPTATNVGDDEAVNIQLARQRHTMFTIPANNAVIKVTVTPQ